MDTLATSKFSPLGNFYGRAKVQQLTIDATHLLQALGTGQNTRFNVRRTDTWNTLRSCYYNKLGMMIHG